jgi:hypothetical protein
MATITPTTAANESADTTADTTVLWQQITERYDCAQQIAAANMMDTKTEVLSDGDMQFVIRVAARLRDKPKAPSTGELSVPSQTVSGQLAAHWPAAACSASCH